MMNREWIDRAEALKRLDVKPQTLYAYVSRQRIAAKSDPTHPRKSLYALDDVERLSGRHPGRQSAQEVLEPTLPALTGGAIGRGETTMDSEISIAFDGRQYYRGFDSLDLADNHNFETIAAHLWADLHPNPFGPLKPRPDVNFPGGPRTRVLSVLSRRLEEDALAEDKPDRNLRLEAAGLLNEMVDAVTNGGPRLFFHQRLARAWKVHENRDVDLVRRALILSAETDFDEATYCVRVAATTGAPLANAVMSGFSAMMGPRLGGRISRAEAFVTQVRRNGNPRQVTEALVAQGIELPGFEQPVSPSDAARARNLIEGAAHMGKDLHAIWHAGQDLTGREGGFSLALALVGRHMDLPREAPLTLYGLGRTAGWLAHAIEQKESGSGPRARLRYVGRHPLQS